jgi:hypothetical protein
MKNDFIYYVSFIGGTWENMVGFYSDFNIAVKATENFVYNNNAKLLGGFFVLQTAQEDYECYSAYGKTLMQRPFTVYIQKIKIDTPIEET